MAMHGRPFLIGSRAQQKIVTRMIIQRAERMAAADAQRKRAFEINLPKLIGSGPFKTLEVRGRVGLLGRDQLGPVQNAGDGAGGGQRVVAQRGLTNSKRIATRSFTSQA